VPAILPLASGFTELALPIRLCAFAGVDNTNSTANAPTILDSVILISFFLQLEIVLFWYGQKHMKFLKLAM